MKWLFIVLIILLLLILLIIISKITILLSYHHIKDDDQLTIKFRIWFGLIRYTISVPVIKIDDDSPEIVYKKESGAEGKQKVETKDVTADNFVTSLKDSKELLQHVVSFNKIVRHFLRKVSIKKLKWHSVIGVGDAAHTASITGVLWSVKGSLIALLSHYFRLKEMPALAITPNFQRLDIQTHLECMIQFRIGNAMLAGIKLVKYWKGGLPKFRSKQLSFISKDKSKTV